jgi:thioredoxin 2
MSNEPIIVRCPQCGAKNRIPRNRWGGEPTCGKCKVALRLSYLYPDSPVDVTDTTFDEEVIRFPGAVLLDFTAPW